MKRLTFKHPEETFEYPHDVDEIVRRLGEIGYEISPADANAAWDAFSQSMCAGWMTLPVNNDDLFFSMRPYLNFED